MNSADVQVVPHNIDAEQALLGSILIDSEALIDVALHINPADFYRERHQWIFQSMLTLQNTETPLDLITISDELDRLDQLEDLGGISYLTDLLEATPTAINAVHYAEIVKRAAFSRRFISASGKMVEAAYNGQMDEASMLALAYSLIDDTASKQVGGFKRAGEIVGDVVDTIEARAAGDTSHMIPTSFGALDSLIGGLHAGDFAIIAGRPGMGKSAFALEIAQRAAKWLGKTIGIVSMEMPADQIVQRMISMEGRINGSDLRNGDIKSDAEWEIITTVAGEIEKLEIYIDDTVAGGIQSLRTKAIRQHRKTPLDLLIIDYVQLMDGTGKENRQQDVSEISRGCKKLAMELKIPVIGLCQLNRNLESRADKRPIMSDLRESGSLEQDADAILFIYREDYYDEDTERQGLADIIVAKARHGSTGAATLGFQGEYTLFSDVEIVRTPLEEESAPDPMEDAKARAELANHPAYAGLEG